MCHPLSAISTVDSTVVYSISNVLYAQLGSINRLQTAVLPVVIICLKFWVMDRIDMKPFRIIVLNSLKSR